MDVAFAGENLILIIDKMKILKFLNILFLLATIYQFYNFKVIHRYSVSEQKLNTEYYYKQGKITKAEYEKRLSDVNEEEKKLILYERINQILLIFNILYFVYWFIYGHIIKKKNRIADL